MTNKRGIEEGVGFSNRSGVTREKLREIVRERVETGLGVGVNGVTVARRCRPRCEANMYDRGEEDAVEKRGRE